MFWASEMNGILFNSECVETAHSLFQLGEAVLIERLTGNGWNKMNKSVCY